MNARVSEISHTAFISSLTLIIICQGGFEMTSWGGDADNFQDKTLTPHTFSASFSGKMSLLNIIQRIARTNFVQQFTIGGLVHF